MKGQYAALKKTIRKNTMLRITVRPVLRTCRQLTDWRDRYNYGSWLKRITEDSSSTKTRSMGETLLRKGPLISIVVPLYNTPETYFREMINSVSEQTYTKWELILVDDASKDRNVRALIREYAEKDERIKTVFLKKNHHISGATNEGIKISSGDFVGLLDHDDILRPRALEEVAKALSVQDFDFIYTDEDKIGKNAARRSQPFFKPGLNQDFLRSVNYITHFTVIRKSVLNNVGYEDDKCNGAQDWELFLRALRNIKPEKCHHIPKVLYSWRVHELSTAESLENKPYVIEAQRNAITGDLLARGYENYILERDRQFPGQWQLSFRASSRPLVSIVVIDHRGVKQTQSQISRHTTYRKHEVIASQPGISYREILENVTGEHLVFINQRLRIETKDWLEIMLGDSIRSDIGFVLAKLNTEDCMKQVEELLNPSHASLVKRMSRRSVAKHLYLTTRYNVPSVPGGVVMIELRKLREAIDNMDDAFDLPTISRSINRSGYHSLYNPYVKMVR